MNKAVSLAVKAVESGRNYRYHLHHKKTAAKILRGIEAQKGAVDPRLLKTCDQYAVDTFGSRAFAPWLYVYSAVAGEFREGWIPDNYYNTVVLPATKGGYGQASSLKPLSRTLLRTDLLPDVGAYVNGLWLGKDGEVIAERAASDYLFEKQDRLVFKVDDSRQGRGVFFLSRADFEPRTIRKLGNGVFQGYIRQHPFFSEIVPGSVATLRITTCVEDDGNCRARAFYLRTGRAADSHVCSASHIRVAVNIETGELSQEGFLPNWQTLAAHPDTGFVFAGCKVPGFERCIRTVLELHRNIPFVRTIGWDAIVDESEQVRIMEWNGWHNDIKFSEATQGPCFADLGWEKLRVR